jgi:starch phosphorylase
MDTHFNPAFEIDQKYEKFVVYLCMEYGIDQALKIYAGGLGFLAGSFLRSAYALKQNITGVGILWKYGYYDQIRKQDQSMDVLFEEKNYSFLIDTGIKFSIIIDKKEVWVKVWFLDPVIFNTAPLYLLSTDLDENDYGAKTITHKLYDSNPLTSLSASILLGLGALKLMEILKKEHATFHLNESHALSIAYALFKKHKNLDVVKSKLVYTNHTPEESGNRKTEISLLDKMGFFSEIPIAEVISISYVKDNILDHTKTAIGFSGRTNCVSLLHKHTVEKQLQINGSSFPILSVTNAQQATYWSDVQLYDAVNKNSSNLFFETKKERKKILFEIVADQCGKIFKEDVCTIVFAKRFAGYKRPDIFFHDMERFAKLLASKKYPVQLIWAGKPYPMDYAAIGVFDKIVNFCKYNDNCAILVGYELNLSKILKRGADIWLNTPRLTHEASGTSGISAAMNGALNVALPDGWFPEFAKDKINSFIIPPCDTSLPEHLQDDIDAASLMRVLETEALPLYYEFPERWFQLLQKSMSDIIPAFDSNRMTKSYYEQIYV